MLSPPVGDELCQRCGASIFLLTRLPANGHQPAYRIFGCSGCTFLKWIAEQITGE
jgi:hypothetical protein